jgi:hypothetical protein
MTSSGIVIGPPAGGSWSPVVPRMPRSPVDNLVVNLQDDTLVVVLGGGSLRSHPASASYRGCSRPFRGAHEWSDRTRQFLYTEKDCDEHTVRIELS